MHFRHHLRIFLTSTFIMTLNSSREIYSLQKYLAIVVHVEVLQQAVVGLF